MVNTTLENLLEKATEAYYLLKPLLTEPKRKIHTTGDFGVTYRRASCGDTVSSEYKKMLFDRLGIRAKFTDIDPEYMDTLGEIFGGFNLGDKVEFASISKENNGPDIAKIRFDSDVVIGLFNQYNGEDNINYNLTKNVAVRPECPVPTIRYRITPAGLLLYLPSEEGGPENTALLCAPASAQPVMPLLQGVEGRGAFELEVIQQEPRDVYDFGKVDATVFYSTVSGNTAELLSVDVQDVVLRLNTLDEKIREAYRPDILDEVTKEMYG